jgi:integrase
LPSDEEIVMTYYGQDDPGWRWVYGMIATFGLRSHEVFYLDIRNLVDGGSMVHVLEGKTGKRMVWACYPEWIEQFKLRDRILPPITGKSHEDYTQRVCKFFGRCPGNFTALDLRHCWAVRTLLCGLPVEVAAKQMGHSVAVHEKTYHRWITQDVHQRIYDAVMQRPDRPLPPNVQAALVATYI